MKTAAVFKAIHETIILGLLVTIATVVVSGCSKLRYDAPPVIKPCEPIIYTDVNPDVTVSYDHINFVSCYSIDLDQDSMMDFVFCGYKGTSNHPVYGQMTFWEYICEARNENKISCCDHISKPGSFLLYGNGETFDSSFLWREYVRIYHQVPFQVYYYCESDTSGYLGLMVVKNSRKHYGWVQVDWNRTTLRLKIKSFALRKDPDVAIKAGEH